MIPKVSIITPTFNKEKYILETINSVINQTFSAWELIIVDDLSTDLTPEIIKTFAERDNRIVFFQNKENKGANYSRNIGILKAKAEFIIFLDADDFLMPHCLANRLKEMQNDTSLDFCVFTMGNFNSTIGDNNFIWKPESKNSLKDFIEHRLPWSVMQPIWRKETLLKVEGFDENFPRFQDVELHTRILFRNDIQFRQILAPPDCYYRIGDDRMVYNTFQYNLLRVKSCGLYFKKFYSLAKEKGLGNKMIGSVYETYLQIINHTRYKKMNKEEFKILENELLNNKIIITYTFSKKILFSISKFYHFYLPRVPGVNKFLTTLILL